MVVFVVEDLDVQRQGVGDTADMPGNHRHRAELAHRPRGAEHHAVDQAPLDVRQGHVPEHLPAVGAEQAGGFLLLGALLLHQRDQFAGDEGHGDEEGHQDALAAKLELAHAPGGGDTEQQVERHRDGHRDQGQLQRGQRVGFEDRLEEGAETLLQRLAQDHVERQQEEQGEDQPGQDDQGQAAAGVAAVVLVQLDHDQQRQDLGLHRHVAGDEDHRAVFADAPGEGQGETGQPGRQQRWHEDMAEHLQRPGAEAGGGFLDFLGNVGEHRLHRADHERQGHEGQRQGDPQGGIGDLEAEVAGELADQAGRRIERGEGDTGDGGGQGEGQVDHGIDDLPSGEFVAHQDPGQQRTDQAIEHGGGERGAEAQLERGEHPRRADDGPELLPAELGGLEEHGPQRDQDQQAEVHQGVSQGQPEAGYDRGNAS